LLIKQNENITNDIIAKELKISLETSKREMAKLIKKKRIERIGNRKNGYWKVLMHK
jgi:predicted HTH transcriptional regulator